VVHPCDESSLSGAIEAAQLGLIAPILVGPRRAHRRRWRSRRDPDIGDYPVVDAPTARPRPPRPCALVREGKAEA
jgi:phosphate acetyltransferase